MKNIVKAVVSLVLALSVFAACTDDSTPVQVTENPYALNQQSVISGLLQNIQQNAYCFTIDYPVTLATYSSGYVIDQTIVIQDDAALIAFIQNLGSGTYGIQYPVSITNIGGVTVDINSNQALIDIFTSQVTACDACDISNTRFSQAYESLSGTEQVTMDTFTHEYTFSVDTDGTVCSIGYQGETDTLEYLVEIEAADGTIVYTGTHTFSNTGPEYIAIPSPVSLNAGVEYTVRRSIPNYDNGTGVGLLKNVQLPITHNGITIQHSRFYGGGGNPDPDLTRLPFIDFVFNPAE